MNPIKVGVDARLLSRPLTGIGRYTMEFCRVLSKRSDITLILYSPMPLPNHLDLKKNTNVKHAHWNHGMLRQLWSETSLAWWARADKLDVFWGPAHRLPRFLPTSIARVVTIHDLVWKFASDTMRPITWWLEKYQVPFAIRSADRVFTDCYTTADAIKTSFSEAHNKLAIISPGATCIKKTQSLSHLQLPGITRPFCLFVGTVEPRKNLSRLLKAYAMLPESTKDHAMLVIAGGKGWGKLGIEKTVAHLKLSDHVKILGYVNDETLALLYSTALFLVFPSLYEGFGLPLVESMSYGVPVLTSNISCMPEIAGEAGLLVNPLDEQSIANGLKQLIDNKALRQQLASRTANQCIRYNWENSADHLVEEFHQAIASRKGLS